MPRKPRPNPHELRLYGFREAAQYLDVTEKNLSALRRRGKMVKPVAELSCGPIWSESQLVEQKWAWRGKLHPRRRGVLTDEEPRGEPCPDSTSARAVDGSGKPSR